MSGNNLVTARASITAGIYSVRVHAVGTTTSYRGSATFHITVATAATAATATAATATAVPNGAIIYGGQPGSLITSKGT